MTKLENIVSLKPMLKNWIELVKLIFFIITISHIGAIIFFYIGVFEKDYLDSKETWLHTNGLIVMGWAE